jgi:hypothetical protein
MGQLCTTDRSSDSSALVLTAENIVCLKESWKLVAIGGFREYGTKMMIKIFLEHKELKSLWKFARNLDTLEQINASQLIKQHGEKLFTTIDTALNMLPNDLKILVPILHQYGFVHYKYGARPEHFQVREKLFFHFHLHLLVFAIILTFIFYLDYWSSSNRNFRR